MTGPSTGEMRSWLTVPWIGLFVCPLAGIAAPGRVTSGFAPYDNDLSKQLGSAADLEAGDAINSVPAEHIMLFHSWLNAAKTRARLLEEPGCSSSIPWARVTDSDVTIKSDGHLYVHVVRSRAQSQPWPRARAHGGRSNGGRDSLRARGGAHRRPSSEAARGWRRRSRVFETQ